MITFETIIQEGPDGKVRFTVRNSAEHRDAERNGGGV
jgi:hypothetical protein